MDRLSALDMVLAHAWADSGVDRPGETKASSLEPDQLPEILQPREMEIPRTYPRKAEDIA